MTERGMIFNGEMVRAILDGRKTQTRRIMKPQPEPCPQGGLWWPSDKHRTMLHVEKALQNNEGIWRGIAGDACPFGDVGDRIWVRETWTHESIDAESGSYSPDYRATANGQPLDGRWTPSIHMPRWASRITLEITDVRVERLASIRIESARAEGYPAERAADGGDIDPWLWFRDLWDGIYPEQTFKHNPWVWVIEFKRIGGSAA